MSWHTAFVIVAIVMIVYFTISLTVTMIRTAKAEFLDLEWQYLQGFLRRVGARSQSLAKRLDGQQ